MALLWLSIFFDDGKNVYDKYFPTEEAYKDQLLMHIFWK